MFFFVGWMVCSCVSSGFSIPFVFHKNSASAEAGSGAWLLNARLSETPSETPTLFVHVAVFILDKSVCCGVDPARIRLDERYRATPLLCILIILHSFSEGRIKRYRLLMLHLNNLIISSLFPLLSVVVLRGVLFPVDFSYFKIPIYVVF